MVDEAIRSIKNIFTGTLVIFVLWLIFMPTAIEKIQLFQSTQDLYAWLYLREYFENLDAHIEDINAFCEEMEFIFFEARNDEKVAGFFCEVTESPQASSREVRIPFEIDTTWPNLAIFQIELIPISPGPSEQENTSLEDVRSYRVRSSPINPLLDSYIIVFIRECPTVLVYPQEEGVGKFEVLRTVENYKHDCVEDGAIVDFAASPNSWEQTRLYLLKHGFMDAPQKLGSSNSALSELLTEADPRLRSGGVTVFGITFSIGEFFALVGFILAVNAFALIGPLMKLNRANDREHSSSWVMVLPRSESALGTTIEILVVCVSLFWSLFPIAIIVIQYSASVDLAGVVARWALPFSTAGLLFSSLIFSRAAYELRLCRQPI